MQQMPLLELDSPVKICGAIHGQYFDLLRFFEHGGFPPESNYLFLGNYVDFGEQSIETICLLLAYKVLYPENFFILRGIHECMAVNCDYGFLSECCRRYNVGLWNSFCDVFNCLPAAAIIENSIFCMSSGLSPDHISMEQIRRMRRPVDVPHQGVLYDLLRAHPNEEIVGWGVGDDGLSFTFGHDIVTRFLSRFKLDLICSGRQVVEDGYEFFGDRSFVTIFSAPDFCGQSNNGAMLTVGETLTCSFQILRSVRTEQNQDEVNEDSPTH